MNNMDMPEVFEALDYPIFGRSNEQVQRLAAVGLMTSGIVHDLGNLIQVFASAVHLIERSLDKKIPDDPRVFIQEALDSVGRAASLTMQILGFSRDEHSVNECVHVNAALNAIEKPISWLVGPAVRIKLALGADVPAVFCSVREFENVVINLVINARDAMPAGGNLNIETYCESFAGGETVVLRVEDNGYGMSPDTVKRVFEPHFTTKSAGNGIGLALVSDFARRAGGSALAESTVGKGTSILLRLPGC